MWDEADYTARWVQGICAILLAVFAFADAYFLVHFFFFWNILACITLFFGSLRLCWRCVRYAVTGKNNVNRDDY